MTRYSVLASRVTLCATQASTLPAFWALLLQRMQWPVPPKQADQRVVDAIGVGDDVAVLRVLRTETVSLVQIARMLHGQDKEARRLTKAMQAESEDAAPFDDPLPEVQA